MNFGRAIVVLGAVISGMIGTLKLALDRREDKMKEKQK